MFKGTIKVFDKDGNLTKEYENAYVITGRYFALESMFPASRSGNTWLDDLDDINLRYFEPGDSTVVNSNNGPAENGGSIPASDWVNGTIYDYDIGNSIIDTAVTTVRRPVSVLRRDGRSITLEFNFDSSDLLGSASGIINEVGIFLGNGGDLSATRYPQYSPDDGAWGVNDRKHGLIARILFVKYNESTDEWESDPIDVSVANQTVQYIMRMI